MAQVLRKRFMASMLTVIRSRAGFPAQNEVLRRFILRPLRLLIPVAMLMVACAAFGSGFALFEAGAKAFAMGVFAPFGMRTNWRQPWIGRFVSSDANIKTVSVEPALAWQTSSGRFAIGGGPEYRRARVVLSRNSGAINPFTGRFVDVANS